MKNFIDALKRACLRVLWHRHFYPACLATALLVRLVFIALFDARPLSDFGWYFDKGREIAAGDGYVVRDDGFPLWGAGKPLAAPRPTAFWPVGYPGFLAAVFYATSFLGEPLLVAKIMNAILYVIAIGAVAYSARVIFSPLAARITALLLTFLPNHIAYTSLTSVEIYFVCLTTSAIALVLLHRENKRLVFAVGAGVCFGLAILTKPQSLLLAGAILIALYWRDWRNAAKVTLIVYATAMLCVLPWSLRNYRAFDGRFVFVSNNGGINLLISNMPGSWGNQGLMWNEELHQIITTTEDELLRDKAARAVFLDYAAHNLGSIAAELPIKLIYLYAADVDGFGWNQGAVTRFKDAPIWLPLRIVSQAYYMALLLLMLGSIWHFRKKRSRELSVGPVVLLYFTGICLVFTGGARFHFPVIPWVGAYASGLLAAWLDAPLALPARSADERRAVVAETD